MLLLSRGTFAIIILLCFAVQAGQSSAKQDLVIELSKSASRHPDSVTFTSAGGIHFAALLRNVSGHHLRVWEEWCSWGYFNLTFMVSVDGKLYKFQKSATHTWEKNIPSFRSLAPNEAYSMEVTLTPPTWEGNFEAMQSAHKPIEILAIYSSPTSTEETGADVWAGVTESKQYPLEKLR